MSAECNRVPDQGDDRPHFVWKFHQTGLWPQKWACLDYGERNHLKPSVVAAYPLDDKQAKFSVDELAQLYPQPADWRESEGGEQ